MNRLAFAAALFGFCTAAAFAQNPQPAPQIPPSDNKPGARPANNPATTPAGSMMFGDVDKNGDGVIDKMEFDGAGMRGITMAQVDTNKDGRISNDEWSTHMAKSRNPNR